MMSVTLENQVEPLSDRRVGQAYLLLAISFCLMVSIGAAVQFWSPYIGLAVSEALILVPAVLYVRWKGVPVAAALGWRPISLASALWSLLLGASGGGAAFAIALLLSQIIGRGPEIELFEVHDLQRLMVLMFCGAFLPGVCEETMFRGVIQGTLNKRGPINSVLITSILFALIHVNPWNFIPPLFLGVVFGIVTLRTGSTVPTMIAHATTNATAFLLAYFFKDEYDLRAQIVIAVLAAVFVVLFSIYLVRTRHQPLQLGPLLDVPAGLSWWAIAGAAAGLVAYGVLVVAVGMAVISGYEVASDGEVPGLHRGDRVLLVKPPLAQVGLAPDDVVTFEHDGQTELGQVERCDSTQVWLVDWPADEPIDRQAITGRVVQTYHSPE
jgi:membrane protease YdiL (CAAX protease family)